MEETPRAARAATMAEAFRLTVADHPDAVALRTKDDEISLTWSRLRDRVDALAGGLAALGVRRGDAVALLLTNRPEFHVADLAAMTLGAVPFSIYLTSSPEQIAHLVRDSGARVAIAEAALADRLPGGLQHVIVVGGPAGGGRLAWEDVGDPGFDAEAAWRAVEPDDLITLIYTSGTTGPPKGVQLTHRNITAAVRTSTQMIEFPEGSRVISWLPAAHIAERQAHHYLPIAYGMTITCCPDARQIGAYLAAVRPTWFFAVPRVFEKLKAATEHGLLHGPDGERNRAWLAAATERVELLQAGEPVPEELEATVAEADAALFAGVRRMLGLDAAAAVNVGAAPTPRDVIVFFHAVGIPLAELWGMSETCGAGCCNPRDRIKIGTVGPAAPGVELRLAASGSGDEASARGRGELLVRSAVVTSGYRGMPERTAEALDGDGWLHTGDVAEIDEDGYVRIVDRKKELIINAAGKNMSPAFIEATLKGTSPLLGQACVIGDGRRYNTALLVLDADVAPAWARAQGIDGDLEGLATHPAVVAAVQAGVDAANARLSRVEQIKRFTIVPGDWAPGGPELTPTLKLKRRPIEQRYAAEIEAMYA